MLYPAPKISAHLLDAYGRITLDAHLHDTKVKCGFVLRHPDITTNLLSAGCDPLTVFGTTAFNMAVARDLGR